MTQAKSRIHLWRRLTQTVFVFLLNPYFLSLKQVCFPVLNCWACPLAAFGCPIGALSQFIAQGVFPFLVLGILIFAGAVLGRMFCGWVCPFGFIQELFHLIPSPKINLPGFMKYGKYLVLLIMVILIPLLFGIEATPGETTPEDFFFCNLCPAGTLEAFIPETIIPSETEHETDEVDFGDEEFDEEEWFTDEDEGEKKNGAIMLAFSDTALAFLTSPRFWVLIILLVAFVFIKRPFCRVFCPLGAIFALFNKVSLHNMVLNKEKCAECNACYKQCPVDHKIYNNTTSPECIRCLECQKKCSTQAIENHYF